MPERPELKEKINRKLAELGYDKILVSNTSGISITRLGAAYGKPEKFMGMHFMNPVPMQKGVEIIRGLATSDETYETVVALCHDLGKIEIAAEDKAGFAINRMFVPFVNEAIRVVEEGIASVDDVDKCTYCLGHKMGPLMTADYVGLDTMLFICEVLEEELGSFYKPSPLLKRLVESGQLGAKTGSGFLHLGEVQGVGDQSRHRAVSHRVGRTHEASHSVAKHPRNILHSGDKPGAPGLGVSAGKCLTWRSFVPRRLVFTPRGRGGWPSTPASSSMAAYQRWTLGNSSMGSSVALA